MRLRQGLESASDLSRTLALTSLGSCPQSQFKGDILRT